LECLHAFAKFLPTIVNLHEQKIKKEASVFRAII
jgi:hypothetical protein